MKRLMILLGALFALFTVGNAQTEWGALYSYSFTDKQSSAFVGYKLAPVQKVFGKFDATLWAVGGPTFDGGLNTGFALTVDIPVAENGWLVAGGSYTMVADTRPQFGLVAGWKVKI